MEVYYTPDFNDFDRKWYLGGGWSTYMWPGHALLAAGLLLRTVFGSNGQGQGQQQDGPPPATSPRASPEGSQQHAPAPAASGTEAAERSPSGAEHDTEGESADAADAAGDSMGSGRGDGAGYGWRTNRPATHAGFATGAPDTALHRASTAAHSCAYLQDLTSINTVAQRHFFETMFAADTPYVCMYVHNKSLHLPVYRCVPSLCEASDTTKGCHPLWLHWSCLGDVQQLHSLLEVYSCNHC